MIYKSGWERTFEKQKEKHGSGFWADMVRLLTGLITLNEMSDLYKMTYERIRQLRNATRSMIEKK